ncbi:MAG: hypothetical protein OHK0029_11850 [Armatimonadaceae bacterium]
MRRSEKWVVSRLLDDSGEAQSELMRWSALTSSYEASQVLLSVLRQYPPLLRNHAMTPAGGIASFVLSPLTVIIAAAQENPFLLALPFIPLFYSAWRDLSRPKIALRAALMLARLNDERAIPFLAQCWGEVRSSRNEHFPVIEELTRLVNRATEWIPPVESRALGGSAARTHQEIAATLREFLRKEFPQNPASYLRDITESEADLFLAVVRYLSAYGTETDRKLLSVVTWTRTNHPNRLLVAEAANLCLRPATEPVPVSRYAALPTDLPSPTLVLSRHQSVS